MEAYEKIRGRRTDAEIQEQFGGDLSAVEGAINKRLGKAATSVSSKAQVRAKIEASELMSDPVVKKVIERLGSNPTQAQLANARSVISDHVMGELNAANLAEAYPGSRVLRNVKARRRMGQMTRQELARSGGDVEGVVDRVIDGKTYVFKDVTDIDAMVVAAGQDGKLRIIHREELKVGRELPKDAQAQVDTGRQALESLASGADDIRLELNDVDITQTLDLGSVHQSTEATRGTSNRGFKESLGITRRDLDVLMNDLMHEALSTAAGKPKP